MCQQDIGHVFTSLANVGNAFAERLARHERTSCSESLSFTGEPQLPWKRVTVRTNAPAQWNAQHAAQSSPQQRVLERGFANLIVQQEILERAAKALEFLSL